MANINQIEVENTVYDLEDNATRTPSKVLTTDANGKLAPSDVSSDKLTLITNITSDNLHKITAGTTDLVDGSSALPTGEIYCVYEV